MPTRAHDTDGPARPLAWLTRLGGRVGLFAGAIAAAGLAATPAVARWAVVYTDKVPLKDLLPYEVVVLDARYHPPLRPLLDRGKTVLGYISVGEVEEHREHYKEVEAEGILLRRNKNWPDSRYVDVRDPRWTKRVIEALIPALLEKGFNGVMLDTLDNPAQLEREDPVKYKGMTEAAARLVRTIRRHYPQIVIMMNRGYEILPRVAKDIDIVLGESVYTDYDFDKKTYGRVEPDLYRRQVDLLKAAKRIAPDLRVFTLDYWPSDDKAGIARIYKAQRANGFEPYVSMIKLDSVVPEPKK